MPLTAAQLNSELTVDSQSYGFKAFISVAEGGTSQTGTNDSALQSLINFPRDGTTVCPVNSIVGPAVSIKRNNVMPAEILEAIDLRDFPASPAGVSSVPLAQSWVESITQLPVIRLANDDGTKTLTRKNIDRLVNDTQGSQTRLDAVAVRVGSRAEKLGGSGYTVSLAEIGLAFGRG